MALISDLDRRTGEKCADEGSLRVGCRTVVSPCRRSRPVAGLSSGEPWVSERDVKDTYEQKSGAECPAQTLGTQSGSLISSGCSDALTAGGAAARQRRFRTLLTPCLAISIAPIRGRG